ncbi:homeobox protein 2-like [Topomyia yanbarensis]|uniref:homeobox protein 2-like n=1 Tax=Topomyia yanbarensis TaxID=2498891 RepID=UPI00273B4D42|nr:homeobox protein 2-like [Topomyia yanbarensis]
MPPDANQKPLLNIVLMTLKGKAATFINRVKAETWAEMLQKLRGQFSKRTTVEEISQKIETLEQRHNESFENYADKEPRIQDQECIDELQIQLGNNGDQVSFAERTLKIHFIGGLTSPNLKQSARNQRIPFKDLIQFLKEECAECERLENIEQRLKSCRLGQSPRREVRGNRPGNYNHFAIYSEAESGQTRGYNNRNPGPPATQRRFDNRNGPDRDFRNGSEQNRFSNRNSNNNFGRSRNSGNGNREYSPRRRDEYNDRPQGEYNRYANSRDREYSLERRNDYNDRQQSGYNRYARNENREYSPGRGNDYHDRRQVGHNRYTNDEIRGNTNRHNDRNGSNQDYGRTRQNAVLGDHDRFHQPSTQTPGNRNNFRDQDRSPQRGYQGSGQYGDYRQRKQHYDNRKN